MSLFSSLRSLLPSMDWLLNAQTPTGPFPSSYDDVYQARAILKTLNLPTEVVLEILDWANYWPYHEYQATGSRPMTAAARGGRSNAAAIIVELPIYDNPIVRSIQRAGEKPKIRALEFRVSSHDQGWTSENTRGTFATSSWTEVSILRDVTQSGNLPPPPSSTPAWIGTPADWSNVRPETAWKLVKRPESALQGPQDGEGDLAWYLQGNRVATEDQEYHIVWTERGYEGNEGAGTGEGLLKELKEGDIILVWARAKWPGWQCVVNSVKVTVHYGF
ncbi:hypothetical protein ACN47E_004125 [Coniothyrium glycines]